MEILRVAASGSSEELVKYSTRQVCSARDVQGNNALLFACVNPDIGCLKHLLSQPKCVRLLGDVTNNDGEGPLHFAAKEERIEHMQLLLTHKVSSTTARTCSGETPLHHAFANKKLRASSFLLANGAEPSACNHEERTAFWHILSDDVVDSMMRDLVIDQGHWQVLMEECARSGSANLFETLMQRKPHDDAIKAAWMENAIMFSNERVVTKLIQCHLIDTDLPREKHTPLTMSILNGLDCVAQKLVQCGAPDRLDGAKMFPVLAAVVADNAFLLSFLKKQKFSTSKLGISAMQAAIDMGHLSCLTVLLKLGEPVFGLDTATCLTKCLPLLVASGWPPNRGKDMDTFIQETYFDQSPNDEASQENVSRRQTPASLRNIARDRFREAVDVRKTNIIHVVFQMCLPTGLQKIILLDRTVACFCM